jgi:NTE family protein
MADRIATLVLSGGGARGAFEVGAERVLREEKGYTWDRIFGVSVGALNATLLAQEEYQRIKDVWFTIREEDVYKKFNWLRVAWRLAVEKKLGAYDNRPLRDLIQRNAAGRPFRVPAHVGRVSLTSGEYESVGSGDPDFLDAVWESTTMPIIWESIGKKAYVDGGLRNVTPLGDALDYSPKEIVAVVLSSEEIEPATYPNNIIDVAKRSLTDITIYEIIKDDIEHFIRINDLVKQAENAGLKLKKPKKNPTDADEYYRYCPITVIWSVEPLGDTLDFSQDSIRRRYAQGEEAARKIP